MSGRVSDAANAGALLFVIIAISVAIVVFLIVAMWKLFVKADRPGWKCLIPVYGAYTYFGIIGDKSVFWVLMVLSILTGVLGNANRTLLYIVEIITAIIGIYAAGKLSKAFGKSGGFTVGLIFLPVIFIPILAFGESVFVGEPE